MPEPITSAVGAKLFFTSSMVAGLLGAVVSLRFASNLRPWERGAAVAIGAVMAQYLTPLAAYELGLDKFQEAIGFFIGLFGLSLTGAVYDTIRKSDPWGLIMSRYGKNTDAGGQ